MEWSAILRISNIDIHPSLHEIVDTKGLIFLSGEMEDACAEFVADVEVSAGLFNQECQHCEVAVLGNVVKSRKVLVGGHIDPLLHLLYLLISNIFLRNRLAPGVFKNHLETVRVVFECAE